MVNGFITYVEARQLKQDSFEEGVFYPKSEAAQVSFFPVTSLPGNIIEIARHIDASLAHDLHPRMYGIDFARGLSGQYYVFELNTRLNQTWGRQSKIEFVEGRKTLQSIVVNEVARRLEIA